MEEQGVRWSHTRAVAVYLKSEVDHFSNVWRHIGAACVGEVRMQQHHIPRLSDERERAAQRRQDGLVVVVVDFRSTLHLDLLRRTTPWNCDTIVLGWLWNCVWRERYLLVHSVCCPRKALSWASHSACLYPVPRVGLLYTFSEYDI